MRTPNNKQSKKNSPSPIDLLQRASIDFRCVKVVQLRLHIQSALGPRARNSRLTEQIVCPKEKIQIIFNQS